MQGKTHLITGMTVGFAVGMTLTTEPLNLVLATVAGGLAGLVPDWLQVNIPGVKQVKGMLGHRGFSHWIWTPLASTYVLSVLDAENGLIFAFLAGWVSHIALDALSNGVPVEQTF
jgi:membrane-bound metal-dependent hydrolase YbcI (DUF457 family)